MESTNKDTSEMLRGSDTKWVESLISDGTIVEKHKSILVELVGIRRKLQRDFVELRNDPSGAGTQEVMEMHLLRLAQVVANNYQTEPHSDTIDFRLHVDGLWEIAGTRVSLFQEQTLQRMAVSSTE